MITEEEAQQRAEALVKQFVTNAGCTDMNDVANVLSKLIGVAGMSMAEAIGKKEAVLRMSATTTGVQNRHLLRPDEPAAATVFGLH